jgi:hypothetical protein
MLGSDFSRHNWQPEQATNLYVAQTPAASAPSQIAVAAIALCRTEAAMLVAGKTLTVRTSAAAILNVVFV